MSLAQLLTLLEQLPGAYSGPQRAEPGPHAVMGVGEGALAAALSAALVPARLTSSGTQLVLSSPDAQAAARDYADLAEVSGAATRRVGTGGTPEELDVLVPGGPLATYHFAQFVAYATGHAEEAQEAERLLAELRDRCAPQAGEDNPARELAWALWGRTPLLLAAPDAEALPQAWQQLLARTGKTLAVPLLGDLLPLTTGAFEARHELGDSKIALLLGDLDEGLALTQEVLESRVDEVRHVPYPSGAGGYAATLALWYFGAWVAAYLAERQGVDPADTPVLGRAQRVLSGEEAELHLAAPRDDLRRDRVQDRPEPEEDRHEDDLDEDDLDGDES